MAKTTYKKKIKNGKEYYFFRLRHNNLISPKDFYAPTVKELDIKIKNMITELDNGIIDTKILFEAFCCNWLFDVHLINKKPSTQERYEGIYRKYIKNSYISSIPIKDLSLNHIQSYYVKLIKSGATVSIIKNLHKLICPCIRYAYNNNLIIKDFTKAITLPSESEDIKLNKIKTITPFTLEEQMKFTKVIKGHKFEILFITALNSGLRQGELLSLTWNDINFDNNSISVNKTVKRISEVTRNGRGKGSVKNGTPKSVKGTRIVPIPDMLVEKLNIHKSEQLKGEIRFSNLYNDKNLVFCNVYGNNLDASNIRKSFKKIILDKELKPIKFHDLRHTYATRLFELGEDAKTVQELLGHSTVSMTLNTYTHVLESMKKKAISKLNDLYI